MKKIICVFICFLFIVLEFASCAPVSGDVAKEDDTTSEVNTDNKEISKAETAKPYLDALPQVKYNRTFNVLCMSNVGNSEKEIWVETASTEPIEDAVFRRNAAMFDNFGVTITKNASTNVTAEAQKAYKANDQSYDLIMANGPDTCSLAQSGYLYNFLDLQEYMNLEKEWWDPGTLRDCAINGKVYFMNGDINILDNDVTWIMLFNKKIISDNDLQEPYDLVKSGNWTLDKFNELVKNVSEDANGDSKYDEKDIYGFLTTDGGGLTNFLYTCDVKTVELSDGVPQIVVENYKEKISDILTFCKKLIHENNYTWISVSDPDQTKQMFMNNQGLFYSEVLSYIVNLSDMEAPFGVIPTPKYDESQKEYRTHVDGIGSMISIPVNVENPEQTAYILEALALYSYSYVTPAYYDVTLKRKKTRDYESSEMIDIILRSRVYDIGYVYSSIGLSTMFNGLVRTGKTDLASRYASVSTKAKKALDNIIKKYEKL